jgi:uronate dehydrogenase
MDADKDRMILVTGSSGRIGRAVASALRGRGWSVRGFDLATGGDAHERIIGDLADFETVKRAAAGVRGIIHLGATPDDDDFITKLLPGNIVGVHHVLEAARLNSIQRIVLASSGQVNWWQQMDGPWPVRVDDPPTPRHWYAATKVFLEAAGKAYAREFGMTIVAVRLGWCPRTREQVEEIRATPRGQNSYLSPGDAGRFFLRAIEAPLRPGFAVVFATSRPMHQAIFDLEPARRLLDWEPQDRWPEGAEEGIAGAG